MQHFQVCLLSTKQKYQLFCGTHTADPYTPNKIFVFAALDIIYTYTLPLLLPNYGWQNQIKNRQFTQVKILHEYAGNVATGHVSNLLCVIMSILSIVIFEPQRWPFVVCIYFMNVAIFGKTARLGHI